MTKRYFAPTGAAIVGTLQTVRAIAGIEGIDLSLREPIYTGDARILWETMRTITYRQNVLYVDDTGARWRLSDLLRETGDPVVARKPVDARPRADADPESTEASSGAV